MKHCTICFDKNHIYDGGTTLPESSLPLYLVFPWVNGKYLYLIICLICRFMVTPNKTKKYMTNIGQNTGILKTWKNVQNMAMHIALVPEYQNLNSGKRRMNGRNSSFVLVGSLGPSSSESSSPPYTEGSTFGERNAIKRFK